MDKAHHAANRCPFICRLVISRPEVDRTRPSSSTLLISLGRVWRNSASVIRVIKFSETRIDMFPGPTRSNTQEIAVSGSHGCMSDECTVEQLLPPLPGSLVFNSQFLQFLHSILLGFLGIKPTVHGTMHQFCHLSNGEEKKTHSLRLLMVFSLTSASVGLAELEQAFA